MVLIIDRHFPKSLGSGFLGSGFDFGHQIKLGGF